MKIFLILDINHYGGATPYYGYYVDSNGFGFKDRYWATEEEVLNFRLSDAVLKRVKSAKVGTKIKVRYHNSCADIYLKRVPDDFFDKFARINEIGQLKIDLNKTIRKRCKEEFDELDILNKEWKSLEGKVNAEVQPRKLAPKK